jgi:hypothetical protein
MGNGFLVAPRDRTIKGGDWRQGGVQGGVQGGRGGEGRGGEGSWVGIFGEFQPLWARRPSRGMVALSRNCLHPPPGK